jgi:hypothetical protein
VSLSSPSLRITLLLGKVNIDRLFLFLGFLCSGAGRWNKQANRCSDKLSTDVLDTYLAVYAKGMLLTGRFRFRTATRSIRLSISWQFSSFIGPCGRVHKELMPDSKDSLEATICIFVAQGISLKKCNHLSLRHERR